MYTIELFVCETIFDLYIFCQEKHGKISRVAHKLQKIKNSIQKFERENLVFFFSKFETIAYFQEFSLHFEQTELMNSWVS